MVKQSNGMSVCLPTPPEVAAGTGAGGGTFPRSGTLVSGSALVFVVEVAGIVFAELEGVVNNSSTRSISCRARAVSFRATRATSSACVNKFLKNNVL